MSEREWPLTLEELAKLKLVVYDRLSFTSLLRGIAPVIEPVSSSSHTHKCTCPNKKHKGGRETNPSFHFSEKTKQFVCYSCSIYGDIFDLMSLIQGRPWFYLVQDYLDSEGLDADSINLEEIQTRSYDYVSDANLKLSKRLRDYLRGYKGTSIYSEEREWVDALYRRIDNRFSKIDSMDTDAAKAFYDQICLEIERRLQKNVRAGVL